MAILVLSSPLPPEPFAQALRESAPDIPVWTPSDSPPAEAVEAILAWRMEPGVVSGYPNLRVLCSMGAGADKLLAPDLPLRLAVTRVVDPDQAIEIAQYVVACVLRFTRELPRYAEQQARAEWRRHPVRARCRVGVLGFGEVGQAIARAFAPLGCSVAGWARRRRELAGIDVFGGRDELPAFLERSDVLVCALPLTPDTSGLLDRSTLSALPRGAYVVNVGRGEHVVEADLRALLDECHLAGAALDVFEREPPDSDSWVWSHPKVFVTPHVAAQAGYDVVARQCVEALRFAREGLRPPRAVDREAGY